MTEQSKTVEVLQILKDKDEFKYSVEISDANSKGIPRKTVKVRGDDKDIVIKTSIDIWNQYSDKIKMPVVTIPEEKKPKEVKENEATT